MSSEKDIILVTGGSGLVGRAIEEVVKSGEGRPNEEWHFISSKQCDLTDFKATQQLFESIKPTKVIHLAAMVGGLYYNMQSNLGFFRSNMAINDNVLACAHANNVQKVVSCLTTCIFPDKTTYPITEDMVHNGPPHNSNYGYSHAKRMIDVLNKGYSNEHGRIYTSIAPTNIFGPYDNYNLETGHVLPCLIHKCYLAKRDGTTFKVRGSGLAYRQFIYSLDLAKICVWAMREYNDISTLLITVDEKDEIPISEAVNEIVRAMDFKGPIVYEKNFNDGQLKKTASNDKLRGLLPNFKFTPFKDAIKMSCDWFTENYNIARK